jgi:hypothetical protein
MDCRSKPTEPPSIDAHIHAHTDDSTPTPPPLPPHPPNRPTQHVAGMIYDQFFDFSRQLNVNVMAYEYSGYGKATGNPSEENCYADIDAAFKYLVEVRLFRWLVCMCGSVGFGGGVRTFMYYIYINNSINYFFLLPLINIYKKYIYMFVCKCRWDAEEAWAGLCTWMDTPPVCAG